MYKLAFKHDAVLQLLCCVQQDLENYPRRRMGGRGGQGGKRGEKVHLSI